MSIDRFLARQFLGSALRTHFKYCLGPSAGDVVFGAQKKPVSELEQTKHTNRAVVPSVRAGLSGSIYTINRDRLAVTLV
jgi:hypothetical protein